MNRVAAVSGATEAELKSFSDQAKELGATTQFSASQAADAMTFLAMAGFKADEIVGAMPGTLQLAAAAQLDMADAADIVSNVLAGYGMEVEELSRVNDVLVKTFTSANTDLRQLGEAMKYAGPIATAAGVQFEEAAAAIGMLGNAGIQGSMAGTSLRGAISRILAPTKSMTDAMNAAGLSFTDAQGRILPLADIIEQLEPHADDAGLMMELFGQRAGPAMAALVSQGSDGLRELTEELRNSGGTAEEIAASQMKGFNGAILELKSAFEALQIAIAESGLLEWATEMVKRLTGFISRLSQTNPELLKMGVIAAGVAAALGPLLIGVGLLLQGLGPFLAIIKAVAIGVAALGAPFTLAAAAIAAAGLAIYTNWDSVGPWFADLTAAIGRHFTGLMQIIQGIVTGDMALAVQGFRDAWGGLQEFWTTLWDGIVGTIEWAWENIAKPLTDWLGITEDVERGWQRVQVTLESVLGAIATAFEAAWERIRPVVENLSAFNDAWKNISGIGPGSGGTTAPASADVIAPPTGDMRDGLAGGTAGIRVQGVTDADAYGEGFEQGMGIRSPSKRMIEYGEYIAQGLGKGINNGQPYVDQASSNLGQSLADNIQPYLHGIITGTQSVKEAFASMLQDMASRLISSGLTNILGSLFGAVNPLAGALRGAGLNAIPAFATGTNYAPGGLARVNEMGGEIINLPRGSQVIPHDLSRQMVRQGPQNVHVTVSMDNNGNLQAFVDRRAQGIAQQQVGQAGRSSADMRYLREGR